MTDLFTPVKLGRMQLPNRIVMAPLTRNRAAMPGNIPQDMNVTYYTQRASAGLIITEATPISAMGHGYPATPGIHTAQQVSGWKKVVDSVHAKGGRIVLQLWHVGRISHPSLLPKNAVPVAPSAVKPAGQAFTYQGLQDFVTPRALNTGEIEGVINEYRLAAQNALQAGFDGVEVHSANGYLLDQFLRDTTNKRFDQYGGSLANRSRLLEEVVATVCKVWGGDRVGVRISPINPFNDIHDSNPQALFNHVADVLNPFNLAYLHVVEIGINTTEILPDFD
ncbi:MAG TPA: alkene reductase, partial [Methylophilaceae bacterium]